MSIVDICLGDGVSLGTAVEVKVIKRHPTGGGIISLPVLSTAEIDLARTAGGGEGTLAIDKADLEQMVRNFVGWDGPVGVNVAPHKTDYEASGPQPAFIEGLSVLGNDLWATMDLGKDLFDSVVERREWRGFSVDISYDHKKPTKAFEGWSVTRGVFTNNPAAPVNFKVAAEAGKCTVTVPLQNAPTGEETTMATEEKTISLANHEAKVEGLQATINTHEETRKSLSARVDTAERIALDERSLAATAGVKQKEAEEAQGHLEIKVRALEGRNEELTKQLAKLEKADLADKVLVIAKRNAAENRISPAFFQGVEDDPLAWLDTKKLSFEALESLVDSTPPQSAATATSSGKAPEAKPTDAADAQLSEADEDRLRRIGLNPKYAGVSNEEQYLKLRLADKE